MSVTKKSIKHYPGCDVLVIEDDELLACPFCGHHAEVEVSPWDEDDEEEVAYQVRCSWCFAETHYEDTMEEAIRAWNQRAE